MVDQSTDDVDANIWLLRFGKAKTYGRNKPLDGNTGLVEVDPAFAELKWYHNIDGYRFTQGSRLKPDHVLESDSKLPSVISCSCDAAGEELD